MGDPDEPRTIIPDQRISRYEWYNANISGSTSCNRDVYRSSAPMACMQLYTCYRAAMLLDSCGRYECLDPPYKRQ